MKKWMLLLAVVSTLTIVLSCNSKKLHNEWTDRILTIDGDFQDWEVNDLQFFEDENMMLGSCNDTENLYIMFRFTDIGFARKIKTRGVTLWLDKKAKKEKTYGIKYRGSVDIYKFDRPEIKNSDEDSPARKNRMRIFMARLKENLPAPGKIWIIENEEEVERPENQVLGASAGSANHDGIYCFEFRIPILMDIRDDNKISLCLELGGLSPEDLKEMRDQMDEFGGMPGRGGRPPGSMGGGMGGRRPGGFGGRRPPGGSMDRNNLEKQDIWFKITLVEGK